MRYIVIVFVTVFVSAPLLAEQNSFKFKNSAANHALNSFKKDINKNGRILKSAQKKLEDQFSRANNKSRKKLLESLRVARDDAFQNKDKAAVNELDKAIELIAKGEEFPPKIQEENIAGQQKKPRKNKPAQITGGSYQDKEGNRRPLMTVDGKPHSCIRYLRPDFRAPTNISLSNADLKNANLQRSSMAWTSFSSADLRGADFRNAFLSTCNFNGADVTGADFRGADFRGADLRGVKNWDKANWKGAKESTTNWPSGFSPFDQGVVPVDF